MSGTLFESSILSQSSPFVRERVFINESGGFAVTSQKPSSLKISQNRDLYQTYNKMISLSEAQMNQVKELSIDQINKVISFVDYVTLKINKSKKPHAFLGLIVKIYNFIAKKFSCKPIEVYDYESKKVLEVKTRIEGFITDKKGKAPLKASVPPPPVSSASSSSSSKASSNGSGSKGSSSSSSSTASSSSSSKVSSSSSSSASSSSEFINYEEEATILKDLKSKKKWGELLDRLKSCYQDDPQEEILRLKQSGILTEDILKKLNESVYSLENGKYGGGETKHNQEMVKMPIARALEIKKYLGDDFWVVVTSNDPRWGLLNYLNKELIRHQYKYKELHNFKFLRLPGKDKVEIATYKNDLTHDHKPETRKALVSCDAYFFSASAAESSMYFLSHASSISGWGDDAPIIEAAEENIRAIYKNEGLVNELKDVFTKAIRDMAAKPPVGTLHAICVPKKEAIKGDFAYLYRAHPFGKVCSCSNLVSQGEEAILTMFQQDRLDQKCSSGYGYGGGAAQYRLITHNVNVNFNQKLQEGKTDHIIIKSFSGLEALTRQKIKKSLRDVLEKFGSHAPKGSVTKLPKKKLPPTAVLPSITEKTQAPLVICEEDLSIESYFTRPNKMNNQTSVTDLSANILLGPQTLGFVDKLPMPFCAVTLKAEDVKKIKLTQETPRFYINSSGEVDVLDSEMIKTFEYDISGKVREAHEKKTKRNIQLRNGEIVQKGLEPTLTAFLSKKGSITLSKEDCKKFNIDERATQFYFVKPIDALGEYLKSEAIGELKALGTVITEEAISQKIGEYIRAIIETLNETYGAEFAALMYIGGYAYFDKHDQLIQVKALVGNTTEDVLPIKKAKKSVGTIPQGLIQEFNQSVLWMSDQRGHPKDGNSTQVTSPELLSYGATHFDWIPPGYIPEKDKHNKASYDAFYKTEAPAGFFMYKFKDAAHDCFLSIGVDPEGMMAPEGTLGNVTILKDGKSQKVSALIEEDCIVGPCRVGSRVNKSNVVWLTRKADTGEEKYRQVACSECNKALTPENKKRFYRQPVIAQYELTVTMAAISDQFYTALHLKPITQYQNAKIHEMCSSVKSVERELTVEFLYPAEKLALTEQDSQLKSLYQVGGYAYYDSHQKLVRICQLLLSKEGASTVELSFEPLQEETAISDSVKLKFKEAIDKNKLPLVTLKSLRARGVRYFMWIPPQDKSLPTPKGMFLYCSADGSSFFSKRVK
jgi:hypothetical protein